MTPGSRALTIQARISDDSWQWGEATSAPRDRGCTLGDTLDGTSAFLTPHPSSSVHKKQEKRRQSSCGAGLADPTARVERQEDSPWHSHILRVKVLITYQLELSVTGMVPFPESSGSVRFYPRAALTSPSWAPLRPYFIWQLIRAGGAEHSGSTLFSRRCQKTINSCHADHPIASNLSHCENAVLKRKTPTNSWLMTLLLHI